MKKMRKFFSLLLILSIAAFSTILFTYDIAQAAPYINDQNFTLETGHYRTLKVHGTSSKVTWRSGNSKVATVSSNGRVTAKGWGTTTISASVDGRKINCKVNVVQISKKNIALTPGKTSTLTLWGAADTATWNSSDKAVATVSSSGKITAKAIGTATITATVNGKNITSKVTVVDISHNNIVLEYGYKFGFVKTLKVSGTNSKVNWSSNNNNVAIVTEEGRVYARGAGDAIITAKVDGTILTSKVKVLMMNDNEVTLKKGDTKALEIFGTTETVSWLSNKKSVATITKDGIVTAKAPGRAIIFGEVEGRYVRSIITVEE